MRREIAIVLIYMRILFSSFPFALFGIVPDLFYTILALGGWSLLIFVALFFDLNPDLEG